MKALIILLLLISFEVNAGGNCNGHYPGDGHPWWHPCHGNDPEPEPEPETPTLPISEWWGLFPVAGVLLILKKK